MSRMGLRARATAAFTAGAALLSAGLAAATWEVTRRNLVAERERTVVRSVYFDAAVARSGLTGEDPDVLAVLRSLDTGDTRRPLIHLGGTWYARSAGDNLNQVIPASLSAAVAAGQPAVQRERIAGSPVLVIGVPLGSTKAELYEIASLQEIEHTLRQLAATLALMGLLVVASGAGVGWWASRRLLRPLAELAAVADRVSAGDLDARLDADRDPDLRSVATTFNTMVGEVQRRSERDRRFAGDVSHELRSPLQTLAAASSVLGRRAHELDERTGAAASLVASEVGRLTDLVEDLLELAKDQQQPDLQPTDVGSLLREVCVSAGLDLTVLELSLGDPVWMLDRRRMSRALANLVQNAQRHGGGLIRIGGRRDGSTLVIEVDDAGPGVPEAERSVIFGRFARGRMAMSRGDDTGSGLGLSLVAQHVDAQGGTVAVTARPGGGARFIVRVPAAGA